MKPNWIQFETLEKILQWESFLLLLTLVALGWLFYKTLLRKASLERHKNIRGHYQNILQNLAIFSFLFGVFFVMHETVAIEATAYRLVPYLGLAAIFSGTVIFVKICRVIVLQYLFLSSMRSGVPVLIVNIFSLILSLFLFSWLATLLFGVRIAPLLATSAAFSIILGLALQDTLGNLFAGISLQLDKSFEIGNWIEISNGPQKIVGQVVEVSWRAVMLVGFTDEIIVVPNRVLAQAQFSNFTREDQPIIRSQIFRVSFATEMELAKFTLTESIKDVRGVRQTPSPVVIATETTDSWVALKLVYYIDDYGQQYAIADRVIAAALEALRDQNIQTASSRLTIEAVNLMPRF